MKANGYGRFIQKIVINVAPTDLDAVSQKLGIPAEEEIGDPLTRRLIWTRLTRQLGNDEDVVFDLWMELGHLADKTEWQIDWEASDY
ncbi:hypothetical protein SAMN05892877_10513 [Rhizobium subbaraonis]|uniref:Uncharacterized protein n=1 Tax=Rhizobium subbaraonis TaxID=908946 RepID=A0A285UC17_9HYPH|nr:hypothetical protein [Rhizobium subbaraonis]SOC38116.1 hypothetical protein SAMN05892877_10513 [Rhizobium subbaraonis]